MRMIRAIAQAMGALVETLLISLPSTSSYSRLRIWYLRQKGFCISRTSFISRNIVLSGKVSIGDATFIGENCILSGASAGITIGRKVMVAPHCVLVAFDHGFRDLEIPMVDQPIDASPIIIEDDVWIAANCTIARGVRLGRGCIVSANSMVRNDVAAYAAVRGVPAKVIGSRKELS